MTNYAPKGAGRAAHKERTNKHAQRTPLPPKAVGKEVTASIIREQVAEEKERKVARKAQQAATDQPKAAASGAEKAAPKQGGRKGAGTAPAAATGARKAPASSRKPVAAAEAPVNGSRSRSKAPAGFSSGKGAGKAPAASSTPPKVEKGQKRPKAQAPSTDGLVAKAAALVEFAAGAGWEVTARQTTPDHQVVTATRGDEVVEVSFVGEKMDDTDMPTYSLGSRTIKLRNVSAARKRMEMDPEQAAEETAKATTKRAPRAREAGEEPEQRILRRRIPWADDASDDEVLEKVQGKRLIWRNTVSDTYDEAHVMPAKKTQRHLRIVVAPNGRRVLNWASVEGGFRSVYVDAIVQVRG